MEEESKTKFSMNVEFNFAFKSFLKGFTKKLDMCESRDYTITA